MIRKKILVVILSLCFIQLYSQEKGVFSGSLETNFNVFLRDSLIGAANTPQYDRQLTGGEAWLSLNYNIHDYRLGIRFDMFNNSNLFNPTQSYSDVGIGRWFIGKTIDKLDIEVGYIYDQIGSGIIYRAYEQRPLLIDNALFGGKIEYKLHDNWNIKAFAGNQKYLFDTNPGFIKGINLEGYASIGGDDSPALTLSPGIGFVNRTLSDDNMTALVNSLKTYIDTERHIPTYNAYLGTIYNTLTYKAISWYVEAAFKTGDTYYDPLATLDLGNGDSISGKYRGDDGSIIYTSLSLALGKLGLTLEGKRTKNFNFRSDPTLRLNRGIVNFIPPMNRVNTYRLTARYAPATQDISEQAFQADVRYRFSKRFSTNANFSYITDLDGNLLYRELYTEFLIKQKRKWQLTTGLQFQKYNQSIYETKPNVPFVETITPYADFLYKLSRKKSIRLESQYMITEEDYGSWLFGLVEVGFAPHWILTGSVMYNVEPGPNSPKNNDGSGKSIAYPTLGAVYITGPTRFNLSYVKQVEGIVCSGGVCRLEPAFSGVRFSVNTTF